MSKQTFICPKCHQFHDESGKTLQHAKAPLTVKLCAKHSEPTSMQDHPYSSLFLTVKSAFDLLKKENSHNHIILLGYLDTKERPTNTWETAAKKAIATNLWEKNQIEDHEKRTMKILEQYFKNTLKNIEQKC